MKIIKLFALSMILLMFSQNIFSQNVLDTIKVIPYANEVIMTKNGSTTKLIVNMDDSLTQGKYYYYEIEVSDRPKDEDIELSESWDMNLPFLTIGKKCDSENRHHNIRHRRVWRHFTGFNNFYWGWRFNYGDNSKVKDCFEVGMRQIIGISWNHGRHTPTFSVGVGTGMIRLLAQDGFRYSKNGDMLILKPLEKGERMDKSRLDIWRFQFPVSLTLPLGRSGAFSLGGCVNLNSYAKASTQLKISEGKYKRKYKGLQQNLFNGELFASISVSGIGFYASWTPFNLFSDSYGPKVKGWSVGINLLNL